MHIAINNQSSRRAPHDQVLGSEARSRGDPAAECMDLITILCTITGLHQCNNGSLLRLLREILQLGEDSFS